MPRQATKAVGNVYYKARIKASKYNQKLLTRTGAAECLPGVTEDSLKKYELGITKPPEEVVGIMSHAYYEPELRNWRCARDCPLGIDSREIPQMPAERALIRLQNSIGDMEGLVRQLARIMDDGIITEDERKEIPMIRASLLEFRRRADENLAILERAASLGIF